MTNIELIEGLEILSVNDGSIPIPLCIVLCSLCFVVIAFSFYLVVDGITEGSIFGTIIALLFVGIGMLLGTIIISETINPQPTYKVLVDDSVSMNEFYDKYEILSIEGKIYTIEPKGE